MLILCIEVLVHEKSAMTRIIFLVMCLMLAAVWADQLPLEEINRDDIGSLEEAESIRIKRSAEPSANPEPQFGEHNYYNYRKLHDTKYLC